MKHDSVQDYYGKVLQSSSDLKTNACCSPQAMPGYLKGILSKLHGDVLARYYGCGLIAPQALTGARVLDLGCGAGRDVYALSAMVGEDGLVVGVDMTPEQLAVAREHQEFHREAFGHGRINTEFHEGFIETLGDLPLEAGSFDVIVSNCVLNLAQDKPAVLKGVYDLLKPGGEMYFSDVYALSAMVGEDGLVVGVDMTPEQLAVAREHQEFHREAFGHGRINTEFHEGYIETLGDLPLEAGSFDVIVSNCVLNLAQDKPAVLKGVYDLLKPGGEMYFSDVYASRRIPAALAEDEVLYGECLSGALYWNDFLTFAKAAGFADPRSVEHHPITVENADLQEKLGAIEFTSATYRLWKLEGLESDCEDYGQAVIYKGTVPNAAHEFVLDGHHVIETGKVFPVCGNTWKMLAETRLAPHFEFIGDFSTHYGIFEGCGVGAPFEGGAAPSGEAEAGGCC